MSNEIQISRNDEKAIVQFYLKYISWFDLFKFLTFPKYPFTELLKDARNRGFKEINNRKSVAEIALEIFYLLINSDNPEASFRYLLPVYDFSDNQTYQDLYLKISNEFNNRLLSEGNFESYSEVAKKSFTDKLESVNCSLISNKVQLGSNQNRPKIIQDGIITIIKNFDNKENIPLEKIAENIMSEIYDMFNNNMILPYGYIKNETLHWTSKLRPLGFVLHTLRDKEILLERSVDTDIDNIKNQKIIELFDKSWNSLKAETRKFYGEYLDFKNQSSTLEDLDISINVGEASTTIEQLMLSRNYKQKPKNKRKK